jgi:type IV pilus assembly protein PilY1
MKFIFGALALVASLLALPGTAIAAPTSIAQLPILNLDDTGAVKPNLMLLYDNSGSMASAYTPDYVDDSTSCRSRMAMSSGTRSCAVGMPPYNSPDFNRQYYDPKVLYVPPVNDLGVSYPTQNSAATTGWTIVSTDAFSVNKTNLLGASASSTNLVTGFPDLLWCDSASNCSANTASYTYPNNTIYTSSPITGNPYYYTIQVAEYCTDANLKTCVTTAVGASAPAGYPYPAKVRWCNSTALTTCQAKYVDKYIYPRFSSPTGGSVSYGTVTIGVSNSKNPVTINSVTVTETSGAVTITNAAVTNANGTTTAADEATLAEALAASIVAKAGLTNQYTACVYKPAGTVVQACLTYGISLPTANNVVAVIPLTCVANATGKGATECSVLTDSSRSGWALTVSAQTTVVTAAQPATATLVVSGTAGTASKLAGLTLGGTSIMPSVTFAKSANSAAVATAIANAITATGVTATTNCAGANTSTVCISTTASLAAGQKLVVGTVTASSGNLSFTATATKAGTAAVTNTVPTTTAPLGAGGAVFVRTDIVPTNNSYPKAVARTDCAAATSCTYAEEMTNLANWYTYYKTRNQMMKTSVGLAFQSITSNFNVGVISLSAAAGGSTINAPKPFSGTARTAWYSTLYAMSGSSATPLRQALHAVGLMYANAASGAVAYPCQQNYTFMTTDGYWNGGAAADVKNNDNVENAARFCLLSSGCVDPTASTAGSLADVALYWYNGGSNGATGSLNATLEDPAGGQVPGKAGENTRLHMNTYTLGLGVDGIMNYEDNYDVLAESGGDFYNLTHSVASGCPWNNNGAYVWPDAKADDSAASVAYQTRVDDLWHTAINGHGKYFSASNPTQVVTGLRSALSNIIAHSGAAAAAATSTPNISQTDNDQFSSSFTTVQWSGNLTDKKIDPVTGIVGTDVIWSSADSLGLKVAAATDTRTIMMLNTATGTQKDFTYANMTALEKTWFDNKCSLLAQCAALNAADRATVNTGASIVGWLRGQQQYANDSLLRAYGKNTSAGAANGIPLVLGDLASSKPAYVHQPSKAYLTSGYSAFALANANRKPAVYVGANDGMMHAFDAATGAELWAYAPRITMPKLAIQTSTTYGTNHQYTVDGSPEVGDVQINGVWKTVLVAGLAGGGRGYFAIDVTDPVNPKPLWETCADATICTGVNNEPELGLTFGNPLTGTWTDASGAVKWVAFVTSGYNNIPASDGVAGGTGKGWLMVLDIATGKVLTKISTGSGDTTTPSGLSRITGITASPNYDPKITYIYGGDVIGQMWRFDLTVNGTISVVKMGDAGSLQPITARPDVTYCAVTKTDASGNASTASQLVVAFGTGRLLDVSDLTNADTQSLYVLDDSKTGITAAQWRSTSMAKETLTKVVDTSGTTTYTAAGAAAQLGSQLGWYVDFDQNKRERVNLDVAIAQGAVVVVTNIPDSTTSCKVGGSAVLYTFDVCTGLPGASGVAGVTVPGGAAVAGSGIISYAGGLADVLKGVDGKDQTVPLTSLKAPVSRRSGWRRIRN